MLTPTDILALAGDELTRTNAEALAKPFRWYLVVADGSIVWGLYKRPGEYSVAVDSERNVFFCSCKKERCRHALGLYLLCALHPDAVIQRQVPEYIRRSIDATP